MRVSGSVRTQISQAEILSSLFYRHRHLGHAFAVWRQPGSLEKHFVGSTQGAIELDELLIEDSQPGFVFAPFDSKKKKLYLSADVVYSFHDHQSLEAKFNPEELDELIHQASQVSVKDLIHRPVQDAETESEEKTTFINLVKQSIEFIKNGHAEKVVPSRSKHVAFPEGFDIAEVFERLCELYPNAMVSLVSIPDVGTWIGATPELLESIDSKKCFKTTALAGTQVYNAELDVRDVMWTQKEIEEQALVTRYIINCFKKIRLRDYKESGPKTFVAGNLIHLKTDFEADMVATGFPHLGSQMLALLHPTSAVCGTPLEVSKDFLLNHEGYDREFYSGFLGPVNFKNETHLYVNIRCMQLEKDHLTLYAGAGVTIDSIAEKEWNETEMKMDTLLKVITS